TPIKDNLPCGKTEIVDNNLVVKPIPMNAPERFIKYQISSYNTKKYFTVLSYNVLAEIYATRAAFPQCKPHILNWEFRKWQILRQIKSFDADIICLQEIQADHFQEFFYPE